MREREKFIEYLEPLKENFIPKTKSEMKQSRDTKKFVERLTANGYRSFGGNFFISGVINSGI